MSWDGMTEDVKAILGDGEKRQQRRHLSKAQQRELARQQARVRVTLDIPDWLKPLLLDTAENEHVSGSSLAAFILARGLRDVREGKLLLRKIPSDSPRFEFLVDVKERDAGL